MMHPFIRCKKILTYTLVTGAAMLLSFADAGVADARSRSNDETIFHQPRTGTARIYGQEEEALTGEQFQPVVVDYRPQLFATTYPHALTQRKQFLTVSTQAVDDFGL